MGHTQSSYYSLTELEGTEATPIHPCSSHVHPKMGASRSRNGNKAMHMLCHWCLSFFLILSKARGCHTLPQPHILRPSWTIFKPSQSPLGALISSGRCGWRGWENPMFHDVHRVAARSQQLAERPRGSVWGLGLGVLGFHLEVLDQSDRTRIRLGLGVLAGLPYTTSGSPYWTPKQDGTKDIKRYQQE